MESRFRTSNGSIGYSLQQGNPNYIFLHGLGGEKGLFSLAFDHPSGLGKGILCVDLLGHGASCRLDDGLAYSFKVQADCLRELLLGLEVSAASFVFHSMSSGLIPSLMQWQELEVISIFLLEGNLLDEDSSWSRHLTSMSDMELNVYSNKLRQHAGIILAQQITREVSRQQLKNWSQGFLRADQRALRDLASNTCKIISRGDVVDALRGFSNPVVYLRGAQSDDWGGRDLLQDMGVDFVEVPASGHYLMLDNPEKVYSTIFDYRARHGDVGTR